MKMNKKREVGRLNLELLPPQASRRSGQQRKREPVTSEVTAYLGENLQTYYIISLSLNDME